MKSIVKKWSHTLLNQFFFFLLLLLPLQVPLLEAGDIIIDGGNSEYRDTTVSDSESLHRSKSLYIMEDVLSVLMCFCHTAAVPESESEGLAVCWQRSQWR